MLKELRIFNIILIDQAEVIFQKGLNVITGETGSGKSAIMHALGFIAGARSDSTLIRRGCEKAAVEAAFEIDQHEQVKEILEASGIDHEPGSDLIIRREISSNGRSRTYINNQMVQNALLKCIGDALLGIVGQHANQHLLSTSHQREITDIYGKLEVLRTAFASSWAEETRIKKQLEDLQSNEAKRLRDIEACHREMQELDEADIKEGEDESLFEEFTSLNNSEEIVKKVEMIIAGLQGEKQSVLASLQRQKNVFESLVKMAPSLEDTAKALSNALLELEEVAHTLSTFQSRIEHHPDRIKIIDDRLALINTLKRRYGTTVEEIRQYQISTAAKLTQLENADVEIGHLTNQLEAVTIRNNELAQSLTARRKTASAGFEKAMVNQLRSLNMPDVKFHVDLAQQKRDRNGDDAVEFFLSPNLGEHKIPLKGCASGGELSRVLLALHTVLSGKEMTPTLVFDEIDANIGGETASVIGEKFNEIAQKQQVICITHFPQVARQANLHLQISKAGKSGRTITAIKVMDENLRQQELTRMLGGDLSSFI